MAKAREKRLKIGEMEFTILRPRDLEVVELQRISADDGEVAFVSRVLDFVIGWKNITEADLYPGGGGGEAPFSPQLLKEWAMDRADICEQIVEFTMDLVKRHNDERDETGKK